MRSKNIDIIKGIGIVLIVAGHAYCPYSDWFISWFVQIFFIASGYVYNHMYSENLIGGRKLITKRIKRLYMPWLAINLILICCNNIFIKFNVLTNNPAFLDATFGNSYGIDKVYKWSDIFISLKRAVLFQRTQKHVVLYGFWLRYFLLKYYIGGWNIHVIEFWLKIQHLFLTQHY